MNIKPRKSNGMEIESYLLTATEKEAAKMERPVRKKPLTHFWWLIVTVVSILSLRIIYLNVVQGSYYREIAQDNRIRSLVIKAPRGKILDRHGNILVNNIPSIDAAIIPADFNSESEKKEKAFNILSEILKINEGEIRGKIELTDKDSLEPVLLKENISQEESLILMERSRDLPGVVTEKTAVREYVDGIIFSHILGYEGKINREELDENQDYYMTDYIGKQGIEKSYEKQLRGKYGAIKIEVNSTGDFKREVGLVNPVPGNDVVLSIDGELQKKLFDELSAILEKTETKTAAAVAINPKNGEILAMVSLPSFDNNDFAHGLSGEEYLNLINNPDNPLFNRALSGEYPPGSTIKPLVAAAALAEGTIDDHTSVGCSGALNIGSYRFGDWKTHGATDVRKAIAESCDVFFYSVGGGYGNIKGLGMSRMKRYENNFGLGEKTGIDIPGEADGFIPDEQWKMEKFGEKWFTGNSYHAAIGQGFVTVTPLQLANYVAAIANGGDLYKPKLVSQVITNTGEVQTRRSETLKKSIIPNSILKIVQEGMRQTVTSGTAQTLNDLTVPVAGKTGTAQFGKENKTHAWFVSYAPYEDPEISMAVLVEGGGEGHSSAVPVTKEVYKWYLERLSQ